MPEFRILRLVLTINDIYKKKRKPVEVSAKNDSLIRVLNPFFLDAGRLTRAFAQVKQTSPTNLSYLVYLDGVNVRTVHREQAFNANAIRHLTDREGSRIAMALDLDHIPFEGLDTFFISFHDLVIHRDVITRLEAWMLLLAGQLFVYKLNGIHC